MRPSEYDGQLVLAVESHHVLARVVRSIIQQQDGVVLPELVLLVHEPDEVGEEQLHHHRVRIRLDQRQVHAAMSV
jgi:hypothetical protein